MPRDLVELLLVLGEVDTRAAVAEEVLDLRRRIGRVEADRDAAHGDGGEVKDHPLGAVLGLDRHAVAGLDTERQQPARGVFDQAPGGLPRVLVPDPEVLLTHGDLRRCALRPVAGQRGDRDRPGRARRGDGAVLGQRHVIPRS